MTDKQVPRWDVKVTSKGQITIPKAARDALMVREGDHLEATVKGDAIVLRRRDTVSDSAMIRLHAIRDLKSMGIDPDLPHPELDATIVREKMPSLTIKLTERIRAQREGREEQ